MLKPSLRRLSGAMPGSRPAPATNRSGVPKRYLLGIDLGTSSVRALLLDVDRHVHSVCAVGYPVLHPSPGWSEQEPDAWWQATKDAVARVLRMSHLEPGQIRAIGLSGQMHGLVLVDGQGRALRPAIVWLDQRSEEESARLSESVGSRELFRTTGMQSAPGIYATSLMWVQRHEPDVHERAAWALLPKDYIRLRMTGEVATDPTDASGSLLFDIRRRTWSEGLVNRAGLRPDMLPHVEESDTASGLTKEAASELRLIAGTPVAIGGGDQAMSAIGSGLLNPGLVRCAIGTGGQTIAVVRNTDIQMESGLNVLCHALPNSWLLMGATLSAGLALQWFHAAFDRDGSLDFNPNGSYAALAAEAKAVPPGSEGLFFLPYLVGDRIASTRSHLRASFIGVDLLHGRGHFIRSIMEGVAYSMKDSLIAFEKLGVPMEAVIASGGAAQSDLWRWIQANVYAKDVLVTGNSEHSAIGAAIVAGVAISEFGSIYETSSVTNLPISIIRPEPQAVELYRGLYDTYRSLHPALY
jgi:xylulokinase